MRKVLLILIAVLLIGCGSAEKESEVAEEATSVSEKESDVAAEERLLPALEAFLQKRWKDNHELKREDNYFEIRVWQSGLAADAIRAMTDDAVYEQWKAAKEVFRSESAKLAEVIQDIVPEAHLAYFVVNDIDPEHALIAIYDDTVILDVVEEGRESD